MDNEFYFGIDFGTTCSAAVGNFKSRANTYNQVVAATSDNTPIPSIVAIDRNTGEVYSGQDAWEKKETLGETCVLFRSIKTIIDKNRIYKIAGREWTPIDIASEIFKNMKDTMSVQNQVDISKATVAIPIGFSASKRDCLREAAQKAGIEITKFISEPTAAFYANQKMLRSANIILVFDWGGGTLDVTILENDGGKVSEIATCGMDKAGDFIDDRFAKKIHNKIAMEKGRPDIAFDDIPPDRQDDLRVRAERAKRDFAQDDVVRFNLFNYGELGTIGRVELTREWFESIIDDILEDAMKCVKKTLSDSGFGIANIDRVLMVGGSSKLHSIITKMESWFVDKVYIPEDTSWNVGEGAAYLERSKGKFYSNQSVGIYLSNGEYLELLSKDTELENWKKRSAFYLVEDVPEAHLVFGGSKDILEDYTHNAMLKLDTFNFRYERIWLTATVDNNNIFKVVAGSQAMPAHRGKVWQYEKLKTYYKLD